MNDSDLKALAIEGLGLRIERIVFSIKVTVVCLTVKTSFPRTQKPQLPPSLKKQLSLLESGSVSEERPNAHMIFLPTELYVGLIKKMAKYEIGKSAALLDAVNEDLHREGFIDDATYERFRQQYRKPLIDVVREKEQSSVVEINAAKLEFQKSTVQTVQVLKPKKRPDYSKMTFQELEERLEQLKNIGDSTEIQFVAAELQKRLTDKGVKT